MSKLFSEIKIGPLLLENRIVIPPMCQYSAANGQATEWHLAHYGNLSFSGASLLIMEATAVSPEGRISFGDLGLWDDKTGFALRKVVDFIRLHSQMPLAVQLAHAGRKASNSLGWKKSGYIPADNPNGWQTIAPSPIAQTAEGWVPKEMCVQDIKRVIKQFADSAKRASDIGFNAVEIHAAHGYLIHEFLSPLTNKRTDEYGGSLDNRMRFPLDVFDAVKAAVPAELAVGIRISATDWIDGGWDLPQSIKLAKALDKRGCDYIHVSGGGLDGALQQMPKLEPGYQLPFAQAIRKEVEMPVIGVGLITKPEQAEQALQDGKADLIAVGRGTLYDPRWGWHAAETLDGKVDAPKQYLRAVPHNVKIFNDRTV